MNSPDTSRGRSRAGAGERRTRLHRSARRVPALAALICLLALAAGTTGASAATQLYSFTATQTIPVPPASNFAGSGGGDGWAIALSSTAVYNVFHHNSVITVACHLQANAEACAGYPKTVSEEGTQFLSQGQPGLYLDQNTGKLYVFGTRSSDKTGGVVCIDTTSAASNPFCGFTALTGPGESPATQSRSISGLSAPMQIGNHWYSFNFAAPGAGKGAENKLVCFDISTDAPCAGQPYAVTLPAGSIETNGNEPTGETAAIGSKTIIPLRVGGGSYLACWDDTTKASCGGQFPVKLGFAYTMSYGAPFPLLTAAGVPTGFCLPTGTDQCYDLEGNSVATPPGMTEAIPATEEWNGPSVIIGPRAYLPNGNGNEIDCYDYALGKGCAGFPKKLVNAYLNYTVNPDPQRPTCLWINSDSGSAQIQSFDAYTGAACGQGTIRVLASQFVVPQPQCTPASYVSMQVLKPPRSSYASGSIAFADGDGNPIGLPERPLDASGTANLEGLALNTPTGLPQFLFTLNGETEQVGAVEVKLSWLANYDATCVGPHTSVAANTASAPPKPPPVKPVVPTGSAKISSSRACVASGHGYLARVTGKGIQSVTFVIDGHKVKTVSHANSHGGYAVTISLGKARYHHLAIHVTFTSASHTNSVTISRLVARCAVRVTPHFTG